MQAANQTTAILYGEIGLRGALQSELEYLSHIYVHHPANPFWSGQIVTDATGRTGVIQWRSADMQERVQDHCYVRWVDEQELGHEHVHDLQLLPAGQCDQTLRDMQKTVIDVLHFRNAPFKAGDIVEHSRSQRRGVVFFRATKTGRYRVAWEGDSDLTDEEAGAKLNWDLKDKKSCLVWERNLRLIQASEYNFRQLLVR